MARFRYKVLSGGQGESGTVNAADMQGAAAQLRSRGCVILELTEAKGRAAASNRDPSSPERSALELRLSRFLVLRSQVELTMRQLASVLRAGVPILTALSAVGRQAPYLLNRAYASIAEKVRRGYSLKRSLREEAPFLGTVTIGLIAVGEANGTLDEMLAYSAQLMERARKVRGQIIQAFTYPAIVVLGAFGVGYYMVTQVFPKIMTFIQKQGRHVVLPLPTRILVHVSDFLMAYGLYILLAPIVLTIAFVLARRTQTLGERIDRTILYVPLLGKAFRDHANTMWCRTLGALLRSGIDVLGALELVGATVGNRHYAIQFDKMREIVRQGGSLTRGLESTRLHALCPMSLTMVSVSEEAGGLDESLLHVAQYSEEQLTRRVALLSKLVEPAIFLIVGGMVGFIYFAFFMAMLAVTRSAR
jgi:type IV pilus assembly protein PilC